MSLTTTITARVLATHTSALDLATATDPLDRLLRLDWASGTSDSQADLLWHDQRTIAASDNEDLDLAGALTDAFGTTLTFAEVRAVLIVAAAGNTNNVRVTRPASNGVPLFLAAGDGIDVYPGGVFLWVNPKNGAATVTAGSADLINVANSSSGSTVTYDVVVIGASA